MEPPEGVYLVLASVISFTCWYPRGWCGQHHIWSPFFHQLREKPGTHFNSWVTGGCLSWTWTTNLQHERQSTNSLASIFVLCLSIFHSKKCQVHISNSCTEWNNPLLTVNPLVNKFCPMILVLGKLPLTLVAISCKLWHSKNTVYTVVLGIKRQEVTMALTMSHLYVNSFQNY